MTKRAIDLSPLEDRLKAISDKIKPQELREVAVAAMRQTTAAWKEESDKYIDHGEKQKFRKSIRTTSDIEPGLITAYSRSGHPLAHLIEDGSTDRWRGPSKFSIATAINAGTAIPQWRQYTGRMPAYKLLEKAVNRTQDDVINHVADAITQRLGG